MNEHDLRKLLAALEGIKERGPEIPSCGICHHAIRRFASGSDSRGAHEWMTATFHLWDEFSGDQDFPVPCGDDPELGYVNRYDLWDRTTEYGQARYRLLDFLIDRAREELANLPPGERDE